MFSKLPIFTIEEIISYLPSEQFNLASLDSFFNLLSKNSHSYELCILHEPSVPLSQVLPRIGSSVQSLYVSDLDYFVPQELETFCSNISTVSIDFPWDNRSQVQDFSRFFRKQTKLRTLEFFSEPSQYFLNDCSKFRNLTQLKLKVTDSEHSSIVKKLGTISLPYLLSLSLEIFLLDSGILKSLQVRLPKLNTLCLRFERVDSLVLPFQGFSSKILKRLHLSQGWAFNNYSPLGLDLRSLPQLSTLKIDVSSSKVFEPSIFSGNSITHLKIGFFSLRSINLLVNHMTQLNCLSFDFNKLHSNSIKAILSGFPRLKYLEMINVDRINFLERLQIKKIPVTHLSIQLSKSTVTPGFISWVSQSFPSLLYLNIFSDHGYATDFSDFTFCFQNLVFLSLQGSHSLEVDFKLIRSCSSIGVLELEIPMFSTRRLDLNAEFPELNVVCNSLRKRPFFHYFFRSYSNHKIFV